ncbi:hypothetical protein BFP97_05280 [Roseivirga sp. 4D4]|uniref:OB-fold protein n=1 Tax=Roseivirga sp. 4D4 TaxID=1889784 RepID=UPI0008539B75|nr:hypothetical protein [Roseivirga sp. 4D4]OEK00956.1 hypothetical protein BFP97_05280 [Roseivirga sp. 4D4]
MKKKRLLIAVAIIGAIAAYFVWANFLKTAPSMRKLDAEYEVQAIPFYNEFDSNEATANTKYLNKIVQVTGEVADIEVTEGSKPIISLKTEGFGVIKCTMESDLDQEELSRIEGNAEITIKAECIGMLLDVLLNRSIIIESN